MRKRMSWDWVGAYPVFFYTTWLSPKVFNVDIIIGVKGDQNAPGHGPKDKPDHSYIENRMWSKDKVVEHAMIVAKMLIDQKTPTITNVGFDEDGYRIGNCTSCKSNGVLADFHDCK